MPGIKIKIDASDATREGRKAKDALDSVGNSAKGAERDVKKFSKALGIDSEVRAMTAGLGKMAAAIGGIYAIKKAEQYLVSITRVAGKYDMMGLAMHTAGKTAGYSAAQMDSFEAALKKSGIAAIEARQSITRLAASGVDLAKSAQLARAAQDLAVVGGINSSEAFERMSEAIQKGQVIMLHTLGINATFEQGYEKMADSMGKNTTQLTENEKIQSRVNIVLEAAAKYQGIYEKSMTSAEKQYLSLTRHIQTYEIAFGKAFQPAYMEYVKTQTALYKDLTKTVSDPQFQQSLENMSAGFMKIYSNAVKIASSGLPEWQRDVSQSIDDIKTSWNSLPQIIQDNGIPYALAGAALTTTIGQIAVFFYGMKKLTDLAADSGKIWAAYKMGLVDLSDVIFTGAGGDAYGKMLKEIEAMSDAEKAAKMARKEYETLNAEFQKGEGLLAAKGNIDDVTAAFKRMVEAEAAFNKSKKTAGWMSIEAPKIDVDPNVYDLKTGKLAEFAEANRLIEESEAAIEAKAQADEKAAKAAEHAAEQYKNVTDELKFQMEIMGLSEREQFAMNQVRAAGKTIDTAAGRAVYDLAIAHDTMKTSIEAAREEAEKFNDFMSDDSLNDMSIQLHEAAMDRQEDQKRAMEDALEAADRGKDAAKEVETAWTRAAENIQDAWAGLLTDILTGEFSGVAEFADGLGKTFASSFANQFAAGFNMNAIGEGMLEAENAGTSIFGGAVSGAMSGFNPWMLGGSMALSGLDAWLGDKGPSYGERLSSGIESLIDALKENTRSLMEQLQGLSDLEKAQADLKAAIFDTKISGTKATLAESFKVPEGVERRRPGFADNWYTAGAGKYLYGTATEGTGAKNRDYTTFDFSREEMADIMSGLYDKYGIGGMLDLMKQTTTDPSALIKALDAAGYISADISDKKVEHYYDGSSKSQRNKTVAEGWVSVLEEAAAQMAVIAQGTADASESYMKTFDSEKLTAYQKEIQDINDTMGQYATDAKSQIKTLEELLAVEGLSEDQRKEFEKQLERLRPIQENYNRVMEETEEKYKSMQGDTLAAMNKEMDVAAGNMSAMAQAYAAIDDSAEKYRLELIDQNMAYADAGDAARQYAIEMKEAARLQRLTADTMNYESRILQAKISRVTTLNKTDELTILNQELVNKGRKQEIQALMDTYTAGTPAYQAMVKLAKETWGFEDAANNAAEAMRKASEAMEGMWTKDSATAVKEWWLSINEALGRAFTPTFFLDSLGLGSSGLEHLLSADSEPGIEADLRELITLWRTGAIREEQANAIFIKINENAGIIRQNTEDAARAAEEQREALLRQREEFKRNKESAIDWMAGLGAIYKDASGGKMASLLPGFKSDTSFSQIGATIEQTIKDYEKLGLHFNKFVNSAGQVTTDWVGELKKIAIANQAKSVWASAADLAYSMTGDQSILEAKLAVLEQKYAETAADDYAEQVNILGEQYDVLQQIRDLQRSQLEETIRNYTAIQDVILDLQGGSLAPVQSLEFFNLRYAQLLAAAQSGDTSDVNAFTNFINQYADFMGSIDGLDYQALTDTMIHDLESLQNTITGGATLDDLEAQLLAINDTLSPMEILGGDTIIDRLTEIMNLMGHLAGYEGYAAGGYHSGGLRLVGEDGPEFEFTGPSRITSNNDTVGMIASAVSQAIGGRLSGGGEITVVVNLDGRAIEPRMIQVIQTNPEAHYQIRRVANGR